MENLIGIEAAWMLKIVLVAGMAITVKFIVKHIKD